MSDPLFNWEQQFPEDAYGFAGFLNARGEPKLCRLDIRLTNLEELKQAAVLLTELAKVLGKLAYDDGRDDVLRVMLAREAMETARFHLKFTRSKQFAKARRAAPKRTPKAQRADTRSSEVWPVQVGNLDRRFKQDPTD